MRKQEFCTSCGTFDLVSGELCLDCTQERIRARLAEMEAELARRPPVAAVGRDIKAGNAMEAKLASPPPAAVAGRDIKAGNATDQKVNAQQAERNAWADQAELTAQFMLTHGSAWVPASMNARAGKDRKDIKVGDPVTTIDKIKKANEVELREPMMKRFRMLLLWGSREELRWPALYASAHVSKENLKGLQGYKLMYQEVYNHLCGFPLTLTHYADAARHKGNKLCLYSRHNLDENAEALGIESYPKGNTPSSAMKNVGHHDYVFCSIEPRATVEIESVFKDDSRFGNVCHVIDSGAVNPFALLTLGDLDTKNAKQSQSRLSAFDDGLYAISTAAGSHVIEDKVINDAKTGKPTTIKVRKFDTLSEQMFLLKDAKEALALKVIVLADWYGVDLKKININAEQYNNLLNGWFVPQVMIPRELVTEKFCVFQGDKRVHPPQAAGHGSAAASSSSSSKGPQRKR
ncbi:hypothetical protein KYC5002_26975 [Archangium violaceum]|uniref:hypothetical protein n=1 Tax=Archangium violaceum TaxID=83451 RepID=UPI002B2E9FFD|nr:hypothetical protein KYC5002_26975 [Archangium gephyra]